MSEHTHAHEAPPNPTPHVAPPSTTTPPCDEIHCHEVHRHQMTREHEVEQDTILGGHAPDGQDGCQRPKVSPPSCCGSAFHFGQAQAPSLGNIDADCRDGNCSVADVSCALDVLSTQSHPGSAGGVPQCAVGCFFEVTCHEIDCRPGSLAQRHHRHHGHTHPSVGTTKSKSKKPPHRHPGHAHSKRGKDTRFKFVDSEKTAELGGGQNRALLLSIQGMDCSSCAHKVTTALLTIPSVQDVKVNTFTGQASLTYKEGLAEPGRIAKRTTELTGYACVVDSAQLEGSKSSDEILKLPLGVEILDTSSNTSGTVLDVQYDPTMIAPRTVMDSFAAVGGSFLPPSKPIASLQVTKDIYGLFIRTVVSFIFCIPVLVFAWAPIEPHPIVYGAISLFLATCIQIYVGGPLYSTAFRSLFLQHTLDTDALVILSSSIAYLFSFVAYLVSSDGSVTVIHADLTQSNDILRVSANTLVPTDGIIVRVVRVPAENTIADISALVTRLQEEHLPIQDLADRAAGWLAPVILAVAVMVVRDLDYSRVAGSSTVYDRGSCGVLPMCDCTMRANGDRDHWCCCGQRGRVVQAVAAQYAKDTTVAVFDKTGTLTVRAKWRSLRHVSPVKTAVETILSLVSESSHPVAQSIAKYLHVTYPHASAGLSLDKVQSIVGKGLEVTTSDGVLDPRRCHIVSGDTAPVVHALADATRHPARVRALADAFPAEKVAHVQELQAAAGRVMFIGDGTNDTPALAAADVSVAMGGGTDVARDTADIVFLAPDLERALGVLLRLSRGAVQRVYINFAWACVYNLFAVLLAAGAFVDVRIAPEYAGLGEVVSVVPVVLVAWSMWFLKH
ncbi:heavy metal translocatin [Lactarius indigo]|nr:heavy metal translocatin [Lactarius indigo]